MSLFDKKVLIALGPGGVGKTTTSVALALKATQLGKNCLVMTIDPSRRLASVLGLETNTNAEKLIIDSQNGSGQLWGKIIEPEIALKEFVMRNTQKKDQIEKLFANKLFDQLTSNLKDSQDFTSIESLAMAVNDPKYDIIVLDTPPIQNLIDFFNSPENMYNLFNSKLINFIGASSDSKSLIKRFIGTGAKGILSILSMVTGKSFVEELIVFFNCLENLTMEIKTHSKTINDLLSSKNTGYLLITEPNEVKLQEADEIIKILQDKNYDLRATVFNRSHPMWFAQDPSSHDKIMPQNKPFFDTEHSYYTELNKNLDNFCKQINVSDKVIKMPIFTNINELEDINKMTEFL